MTSAADPFAEFAVAEPATPKTPTPQPSDPFAQFAVAEPSQPAMDFAGNEPPVTLETQGRSGPLVPNEDDELAKDARARAWFEAAQGNPAHEIEAFDLSRASGAPIDMVRNRIDDFRKSYKAAGNDVRQWRNDNPDLEYLLTQVPQMAPVVTKDQTRWRTVVNPEAHDEDHPILSLLSKAFSTDPLDPAGSLEDAELRTGSALKERETRQVNMQDLSHLGTGEAVVDAAKRGAKQNWISKQGFARAWADITAPDSDTARSIRENVLDQQQKLGLPAYYGDGIGRRLATATAEATTGQIDSAGALALGAVAGLVTRRPQIIEKVAKIAGAPTSFVTETGGAYNDFADTLDDQGKPIDRHIAFAAAHMYGALATAIETGVLGMESKGITAVDAKRWFASALTDKTKRGIFLNFGKTLLKNAGAEAVEEGSQEALQIAAGYIAQTASAGTPQSFDKDASIMRIFGSALQGALGSIAGIGGVTLATNTSSQLMNLGDSHRAGAHVAAITDVAKTDAAQRAPKQVAAWIASQQQADGRTVTHLYVDPHRLVEEATKGGAKPEQVATELMGPDGPQRLQDALDTHGDAPGARATLEVPVAEYLEKWGGKPIAEALAEDISTGPGLQTMRELRLFQRAVQSHADAIANGEAIDGATPQETALVGNIEQQLVAAGRPVREAKHAAAVVHAMASTLAQQSGRTTEEVLAEMPTVSGADTAQSTSAETLAQPGVANLDPVSIEHMRAAYADLTPAEQQQIYYRDQNTHLLNLRALEANWADQSRPLMAVFGLEGQKFHNDTFGHGAVDGAHRIIANAIRSIDPSAGAKLGGDIGALVTNEAQAQQMADAINAKLPEGVRVTHAVGPRMATAKETIDAVDKVRKAQNEPAIRAGDLGHRQGVPVAFLKGEPRIGFGDGIDKIEGLDPKSEQAQAAIKRAIERARPVAKQLEQVPQLEGKTAPKVAVTPAMEQAFAADPNHFETSHLDAARLVSGEAFKRLRKTHPKKFFMSADLRGFGPMNAFFGRAGTDAIKAWFNRQLVDLGAGQFDTSNGGGSDEYFAHSDDAEAMGDLFAEVQEQMRRFVFVQEHKDGSFSYQLGLYLAHGIDPNEKTADLDKLAEAKRAQDAEGAVQKPGRAKDRAELGRIISEYGRRNSLDLGPESIIGIPEAGARGHRSATSGAVSATSPADQVTNHTLDALSAVGWAGAKTERLEQSAWHGTPHRGIEKFSLGKVGHGQGGQSHGWGLYFSNEPWVADTWRKMLGRDHGVTGQLHKVDLPENEDLLDYDKPLSQQSPKVIERLIAADIITPAAANSKETGEALYNRLSKNSADNKAASEALRNAGIPGLRYLDNGRPRGEEPSHSFVIWSEDAIKKLETLYQDDASSPRGWIDIVRDGVKSQYKIFLTKKADASTFLHESAHAYFEMLGELAAKPDAPERLTSDWATIRKWIGAEDGKPITVEQKEKFARGFEAYLLEGKTPSSALAEAFGAFRRWLTEIYKSIASLGVELDDNIRGVFDRMLATDREVERARSAAGLSRPVFSTPDQAGVDPKDFDAYLAAQERIRSDVIARTQRMIHEGELRAAKAFKAEEFKRFKQQFSDEWDQLSQVRAWRYMRLGEITLPDGSIDRNTGRGKIDRDEVVNLLGADHPLIKKLTGRLAKGGESPIDVADMFGFASTKDMLETVAHLPEKDTWVNSEAQRAMRDKHPEIDGEIANLQAAIQKLQHEDSYDQAERDWRLIKARTRDPVTIEALKQSAKAKVQAQVVGRIDPGVVLNRERTFATQMAQAVAEGNFERAMAFAHRRLLHKYMWRELVAAKDMRDKFYDLASDMLSDKRRAQLGKAGPEYRDVTDSLLEAIQATPARETDQRRRELGDLLARMDADGNSVAFDEDFIGSLLQARDQRSWKELKVSELQMVLDALQNIKASARNMTTALQDGKRIDREKWIGELIQSAEANVKRTRVLPSSPQAASFIDKAIAVGEAFDGMNLRPETMLEWLGGDDIDSPWHALVQMLQDAKHKQSDLIVKTVKPISQLFDDIPKNVRRRLRERIDGGALFPNHRKDLSPPSRRFELLMMALNAGNESNLQRLIEGRGITPSELHAALSLLTKDELDWVQTVWDQIESLWSSVRELEERDTGLAPPKIAPVPLNLATSDGKKVALRGGYFPAVYDGRVSGAGERVDLRNAADALDISLTRPSTNRSHTKSRADKFADVISLNPATIQSHLVRVTHDIAYREPIRSAASIMLDPNIKRTLREKLGPERAKVFEPWLRDIGRLEAAQAESHGGAFTQMLRMFRSNVPVAVLGHAIDNYLGDTTGLLTAMIGSGLSKHHYAAGLAQYAKSAFASRAFALSKSGELRSRGDDTYQGFQRRVRSLAQGRVAQVEGAIKEHAFFFAEQLEKVIVTPVWLGAYRQAQAEGRTDKKAVDFADSIVRRSFPSKNVVDKAAIQRDKGMLGFMSMFVGYANWSYNQYRRLWQPVLAAEGIGQTTLAATSAMLQHLALAAVIGPLAELLVGHGPEPGEDWDQWMMRKLLLAHLLPLPLVGGFLEEKIVGHASNRTNPGLAAAESIFRAFQKAADDEAEPMDALLEAMKAYGYLRGLPAVRPIRWLEYLLESDGTNDGGVASGLLYGNREGQPTNLINMVDR